MIVRVATVFLASWVVDSVDYRVAATNIFRYNRVIGHGGSVYIQQIFPRTVRRHGDVGKRGFSGTDNRISEINELTNGFMEGVEVRDLTFGTRDQERSKVTFIVCRHTKKIYNHCVAQGSVRAVQCDQGH